jgi:hypothetical protein
VIGARSRLSVYAPGARRRAPGEIWSHQALRSGKPRINPFTGEAIVAKPGVNPFTGKPLGGRTDDTRAEKAPATKAPAKQTARKAPAKKTAKKPPPKK